MEYIWVVSTDETVGLWETSPDHPGGEVFVAGDEGSGEEPEPVKVAMTSGVRGALSTQRIRQVPAPAAEKYDGWTNDELREELETRGLPTSGVKAELLERLTEDDG